jgi:hypothetical protein
MLTTAVGDRLLHGDLSERIIGAYFNVYNAIGFGFLESVYQRAMVAELQALGLAADSEIRYQIYHRGQVNYLAASGLSVGLLFNFGQRATFRRLARSSPKQSIPGHPK